MEETKKEEVIKEFNHFCSKLNFKDSALDCRAIQFMNEFNKYLD